MKCTLRLREVLGPALFRDLTGAGACDLATLETLLEVLYPNDCPPHSVVYYNFILQVRDLLVQRGGRPLRQARRRRPGAAAADAAVLRTKISFHERTAAVVSFPSAKNKKSFA